MKVRILAKGGFGARVGESALHGIEFLFFIFLLWTSGVSAFAQAEHLDHTFLTTEDFGRRWNRWMNDSVALRAMARNLLEKQEPEIIAACPNLDTLLSGKELAHRRIAAEDVYVLWFQMDGDILPAGCQNQELLDPFVIESWCIYLIGFDYEFSWPLWVSLLRHVKDMGPKAQFSMPVIKSDDREVEWREVSRAEFFLWCLESAGGGSFRSLNQWHATLKPLPEYIRALEESSAAALRKKVDGE